LRIDDSFDDLTGGLARADLGPFGGGFLLYLRMHDNPTDMAAVLRDYSKDMILPARSLHPRAADRRHDV